MQNPSFHSLNTSIMDSSGSNFFDIFEIYRRYCDITSGKENQNPRETLAQLRQLVELRGQASSLFSDLSKLMSYLDLTVDSCRFACFYDFVYFMCRSYGQKNITVEKAIEAWQLVLNGRFRLLNEWCAFVKKHQRHNISEDTWQQVLAFSRCVHEDLQGYDPKGAWPVLIDEFVDHMHRITASKGCSTCTRSCSCIDSESQECRPDNSFPGLKLFAGSKRKSSAEFFNSHSRTELMLNSKRNRTSEMMDKPRGDTIDDQMEIVKHGALLTPSKNMPCAIERSLSEGFAGLLSNGPCLQFDQKPRFIDNRFQPH